MSTQFESFLINLLSSFTFAILTIIIAYFTTFISRRSSRIKKLKVLKLDDVKDDIYLAIYTSHLVVSKGEAKLIDGSSSMYFEGSAVPIKEIEASYKFKEKLSLGILEQLPDVIRTWLVKHFKGYNKIIFDIKPAPLDISSVKNYSRLVLIGGSEFNSLTNYFLNEANLFCIDDAPDCIHPLIKRCVSTTQTENIRPDSDDYNLGLVQRITFTNNNQVILFLVGIGTNGTLAAVDWFIKNWTNIDKIFKDNDFGIVLECLKRTVDPEGYKRARIRKSFPEIAGIFK